jgi:hypothetical protein
MSLFALHFTQYACVANERSLCMLGYKNSYKMADFLVFGLKTGAKLGKKWPLYEKISSCRQLQSQFCGKKRRKACPAACLRWNSLVPPARMRAEFGIRQEGKSGRVVCLSHLPT